MKEGGRSEGKRLGSGHVTGNVVEMTRWSLLAKKLSYATLLVAFLVNPFLVRKKLNSRSFPLDSHPIRTSKWCTSSITWPPCSPATIQARMGVPWAMRGSSHSTTPSCWTGGTRWGERCKKFWYVDRDWHHSMAHLERVLFISKSYDLPRRTLPGWSHALNQQPSSVRFPTYILSHLILFLPSSLASSSAPILFPNSYPSFSPSESPMSSASWTGASRPSCACTTPSSCAIYHSKSRIRRYKTWFLTSRKPSPLSTKLYMAEARLLSIATAASLDPRPSSSRTLWRRLA